jgi:NAD(P)-dependent dehydrogenase (short-subunit alcohol dehydrogenase family)
MKTTHALGIAAVAGACGLVLSRLSRTAHALDFYGKSVVIFGGSRGLGLEIARQLAAEGAYVTICARDAEELERARIDLDDRGFSATTIPCDIRDRRDAEAAIHRVIAEHGAIDVLINDAGIMQVGPVELMTVADFEDAMATHFWGPLFTILAALPHMRHAGDRRIVNISSIGGKIAVPHVVPYSASKFALTGLSEGLRAELAEEGFAVTTVCPGLMRTGSTYNALFKGRHQAEFVWFHVSDSMPVVSISVHRAAKQVIEACRHGVPELIITPLARLAVAMNGISPSVTQRMMAIASRLMPSAGDADPDDLRLGWESVSRQVPSVITRLTDRAAVENNELPAKD